MIENTANHTDMARRGTGGLQQPSRLRTRRPRRQHIIHQQHSPALNDMRIPQAKGSVLVQKALTDRDPFLRPGPSIASQYMDITDNAQSGTQQISHNPCWIEMPRQPLLPVLRYGNDAVNVQLPQRGRLVAPQQGRQRLHVHTGKRPFGVQQCLLQLISIHPQTDDRIKMQRLSAAMNAAVDRRRKRADFRTTARASISNWRSQQPLAVITKDGTAAVNVPKRLRFR